MTTKAVEELNADELIQRYVLIRDKKAELEAEHKTKVARINEVLKKIEVRLQEQMTETGADSLKTGHGTCYLSTRTTAKVADRDAFLQFVQDKNAWEFIESRVNAKAVEAFVEENQELPPGVTTTRFTTVGVRRATTGE